jgi:hypothetical protein
MGALLPSLNAGLSFNGSTFRQDGGGQAGPAAGGAGLRGEHHQLASQSVNGGVQLLQPPELRSYGAVPGPDAARGSPGRLSRRRSSGRGGAGLLRRGAGASSWWRWRSGAGDGARQQLRRSGSSCAWPPGQPTDVLGAELEVAQAEQAVQQAGANARKGGLSAPQAMGVAWPGVRAGGLSSRRSSTRRHWTPAGGGSGGLRGPRLAEQGRTWKRRSGQLGGPGRPGTRR